MPRSPLSRAPLPLLLAVLAAFCLPVPAPAAPLRIVASILPLRDMAQMVAGPGAEVTLLLPPGAGPHAWSPRPGDMERLRRADLVVAVGGGLEPWLRDLAAGGKGRVLSALPDRPGGHADPHVWLDPGWDRAFVHRLAEALAALDPGGAAGYARRAAAAAAAFAAIDADYRRVLGACAARTLVVAGHAAFGHLARAYGLEQQALTGRSPDARPSPRRMAELAGLARRRGVAAVFYEPGEGDRLARALAREAGVKALPLTPGVALDRADIRAGVTFLDLLRRNLRNLAAGLGCRQEPQAGAEASP
ncbi:zinc ABC transporter substrate-binding protein [Dissulfurirhabdus thermomarina]|uniref:Zinc ABC transporter substrate-binding protein n=1 Tax=Dissulfurirhabdus thermomarina TaxID=1765737 RepID=A0A6N9TN06_DISTH|nr:metal ABC transporter substrate-binding protein [Dissulfurirhabdus thermomarina]NDY41453.1 zinc ABC transporter substrate-binding protein [Dissulfurirhabdus thermomarina]NMX24265.1 zinc ABC transporter substrate-binding protein [Dissulfurirhabdus thermomarina]